MAPAARVAGSCIRQQGGPCASRQTSTTQCSACLLEPELTPTCASCLAVQQRTHLRNCLLCAVPPHTGLCSCLLGAVQQRTHLRLPAWHGAGSPMGCTQHAGARGPARDKHRQTAHVRFTTPAGMRHGSPCLGSPKFALTCPTAWQ